MQTKLLQSSERIYALDALRSVMMLLGIVIHGALTYMVTNNDLWPIKDTATSLLFDLTNGFIHSFRMPVFFVVSGFFCALLVYKKGADAMLINRVKRIVLPLLAGVLIVGPLETFALTFAEAKFEHASSPFRMGWGALAAGKFLPFLPGHLWFLYFLGVYALISRVLVMAFRRAPAVSSSVQKALTVILQHAGLRLTCVSLFFFLCLYWQQSPYLLTSFGWSLVPSIMATYFLFFGLGWCIYTTDSLTTMTRYPVLQLSIATLLLLVQLSVQAKTEWALILRITFSALNAPLFVFGFLALFLTCFAAYSPRMSYLAEAAYWVYIIHLPIIMFIVGLLADYPLPAVLKFAITFSATCIVALVSYHYLVRNTFIGLFLNGKVHKPKAQPPARLMPDTL
ncbi:acyltransferase family protein [Arsenicibacter rosenii]|uniref:Acyltransferase 3 domain-containing protein n=1 Tax=Arsenicibacter rosenii TaxID=1750698 RepID=A0A1S2VBW0_9BACT|nr:acyltransferase family protein [Arsenicibacter rosenii]OIN56204.1 hypothetical protein BLX24_25735 [Arsenicibacter rosenii]